MVTVIVRFKDDHPGIWPRVLKDVLRWRAPLPEVREMVELLADDPQRTFLAMGMVERVNEEARTYDVRIW